LVDIHYVFTRTSPKTAVHKPIGLNSPESSGDVSVEEILRASILRQAQGIQVIAVGWIEIIMIDIVVVAGSEGAPGNPRRSAIKPDESGRPKMEAEGGSREPAPTKAAMMIPASIMIR
jgi:hypothetical protein